MVYEWKSASHISADANAAGALFKELESTVGLTPKNLLDVSRDESAVLHNEFEWDDTKAAESYRENQAAHLIRCICIIPDTAEDEKQKPVRAFFTTVETNGYESTEVIFRDSRKRDSLLTRAMQELNTFHRKYAALLELQPVFDAIKALSE